MFADGPGHCQVVMNADVTSFCIELVGVMTMK